MGTNSRAARAAWALVGAVLLAGWACTPRGRTLETGPSSFWLASNGFDDRREWPSTLLHLRRDEMGGATRISYLLDRSPEVLLLQARGEGWGVHLRGPEGEPRCELDVWLNGVHRLRPPVGPLQSVDGILSARSLSGLEIHVGYEGPVREPEGCGALLLWSEEAQGSWEAPFRGRVVGRVRGDVADTVVAVRLEPDGQRIRPDAEGRYELAGVVPGVYQVVFMTAAGPIFRRTARVYAFADTRVDVEVSREEPGQPSGSSRVMVRRRAVSPRALMSWAWPGPKKRTSPFPSSATSPPMR